MIAYKFYSRQERAEDQLIGVLPERRNDQKRISRESVLNWVKMVTGADVQPDDVYFVVVEIKTDSV